MCALFVCLAHTSARDVVADIIHFVFVMAAYIPLYTTSCEYLIPNHVNEQTISWISTYMLVGTAKDCASVGLAGADHKQLVEDIISELVAAVSAKEGIAFQSGAIERLAAYTDVVTDFPCGVKEFEWRNQYFYDLGDEACPLHNGLLRECAEKGKLGFELP